MNDRLQRLSRLAMLMALATIVHTAEAFLPVTVLWFRFGFANIIGLVTLYLFGLKDALLVTWGRIFLGSLVVGMLWSPAFMLSLCGGTCAVIAMGLTLRADGKIFSVIGVSVIGAICHNAGQLAAAYIILIRHEGVLLFLPPMLLTAVGTGIVNGIAARLLIRSLDKPGVLGARNTG